MDPTPPLTKIFSYVQQQERQFSNNSFVASTENINASVNAIQQVSQNTNVYSLCGRTWFSFKSRVRISRIVITPTRKSTLTIARMGTLFMSVISSMGILLTTNSSTRMLKSTTSFKRAILTKNKLLMTVRWHVYNHIAISCSYGLSSTG